MSLAACSLCLKEARLTTHHLIPRWLDGDDGDTFEVCKECHNKLEGKFLNFLKWGAFRTREWHNRRKRTEIATLYNRRVKRWKVLFYFTMEPKTFLRDVLVYNLNTGHVFISRDWGYRGGNEIKT